jgi:hypothetical protein
MGNSVLQSFNFFLSFSVWVCGRAEELQLRFSGRKTPVTRHRFTRNSAVASFTTSDSDVPICAKSATSNVLTGKVFGIPLSGKMARGGKRLKAVRLASGDMISLSRRVRQILDEAGFERVKILPAEALMTTRSTGSSKRAHLGMPLAWAPACRYHLLQDRPGKIT